MTAAPPGRALGETQRRILADICVVQAAIGKW